MVFQCLVNLHFTARDQFILGTARVMALLVFPNVKHTAILAATTLIYFYSAPAHVLVQVVFNVLKMPYSQANLALMIGNVLARVEVNNSSMENVAKAFVVRRTHQITVGNVHRSQAIALLASSMMTQ